MEDKETGVYMLDQDPKVIASNKAVLADLQSLISGSVAVSQTQSAWLNRLRREGMGK